MLNAAFLAAANHVLAQNRWARERLALFAGRRARFEVPPWTVRFEIDVAGSVVAPTGDDCDVVIRLPAKSPLLLLQGIGRLIALARVEGNAEFATALSFVLREMRWDVEEDLSRLLGDIAAHRLVHGSGQLFAWQRQGVTRLTENLAEYFAHESALLVSGAELRTLAAAGADFEGALARTEARLLALGS